MIPVIYFGSKRTQNLGVLTPWERVKRESASLRNSSGRPLTMLATSLLLSVTNSLFLVLVIANTFRLFVSVNLADWNHLTKSK